MCIRRFSFLFLTEISPDLHPNIYVREKSVGYCYNPQENKEYTTN